MTKNPYLIYIPLLRQLVIRQLENLQLTAPTQKAGFSFRFDNLFFIFIFYFYDLNLRATALRVAAKRYCNTKIYLSIINIIFFICLIIS
jgi:hypothetical protein